MWINVVAWKQHVHKRKLGALFSLARVSQLTKDVLSITSRDLCDWIHVIRCSTYCNRHTIIIKNYLCWCTIYNVYICIIHYQWSKKILAFKNYLYWCAICETSIIVVDRKSDSKNFSVSSWKWNKNIDKP